MNLWCDLLLLLLGLACFLRGWFSSGSGSSSLAPAVAAAGVVVVVAVVVVVVRGEVGNSEMELRHELPASTCIWRHRDEGNLVSDMVSLCYRFIQGHSSTDF